ncbi:MAG: hypothetical protein AB7O62_19865, partial [Pirellulales bacterium]
LTFGIQRTMESHSHIKPAMQDFRGFAYLNHNPPKHGNFGTGEADWPPVSGMAHALPLAAILIVPCLSAFHARWKAIRTSSRQSRTSAASLTCTTP